MKRVDWGVPERVWRVTVRLGEKDIENMEAIRKEALGRRGSVRMAMSYADTIREALAVAAREQQCSNETLTKGGRP